MANILVYFRPGMDSRDYKQFLDGVSTTDGVHSVSSHEHTMRAEIVFNGNVDAVDAFLDLVSNAEPVLKVERDES